MNAKWIIVLSTGLIVTACNQGPSNLNFKEPGAVGSAKKQYKTFDRSTAFGLMMETVVKPKCLSCHDSETKKGKVDLSSYESIMGTSDLVVPGEPSKSELFRVLAENEMPPRPNETLSTTDKDTVHKWIASGAKDETGKATAEKAAPAEPVKPVTPPTPTPAPIAAPAPIQYPPGLTPYNGQYPTQYPGQYTGYTQLPPAPSPVATPAPTPAPVPMPTGYSAIVKDVLAQNCFECHGVKKKKAGLDFTSYEKIMGEDGLIVPGNPDESPLYIQVRDQMMPPDNPLKDELKSKLYEWIKSGAKN
ncbi:MAG: c-type cytochrome domain-containing protein [Bdellovibrionia bacterium]